MANAKISALNEVTGSNLDDEDVLAIVNATETKKVKFNELISAAGLNKLSGTPIPSGKVAFASGAIVEASMATDSVNTAAIKNDNVTAAKLGNDIAKIQSGTSGSGDFTGQLLVDTSASNKIYVWDGSSWDALVAGTTTISGSTSGIINVVSTASGTTYTLSATVDDTDAANKFLAGPTGAGGAVSARVIAGSDLPDPTTSAKGGVIINGNGLTQTSGTIKLDNSVSASGSTYSVCQHDANGLVTASRAPTSADLPVATSSAKGAVKPGSGLSVDGNGSLTITNSVSAGTYTKITVDGDGLATAGTTLADSDLPNHSAALLTSGTLPIARIADDAITAAKMANSSTCVVQSISQAGFPTAAFTGQLLFDSVAEDAYLWDGNAWQAITTLTKGSLVNGGTFNASTSKMASVTTAGSAAGLVVGSNLPTPSATTDGVYVVVATAGTPSAPAPVVALNPPDYILAVTNTSGSSWNEIDLSATVSGQTASNVSFTPYGQVASTNTQDAIEELETEKMPKAGGTFTGAVEIGHGGSFAFEGATNDGYETTIAVTDPTADRTITLPNASGTVLLAAGASIVNADVATNAAIAYSKLAALTDGNILVGNGSNVATSVTPSGDVTISNAGAFAIASGVIVNADINASAAIAGSKLAAGSTSAQGALQLEDSAASTSTTKAATPAAVKVAKDAADAAATTANAAIPKAGGTFTGDVNLGVDDTGVDLKLFGATASAYVLWDASADELLTGGGATVNIVKDKLKIGGTAVTTTAAELNILDGVTSSTAELNILDGVTSTAAELNILDGVTSTAAELNILDGVTSTATELNILDGVTSTTAELNILDGVTATATEINLLDGKTAVGDAVLASDQTWSGAQRGSITALSDASTVAVDFNSGNNFSLTLAGNRTLGQPSNQVAGQSGAIFITQDGTGSRTLAYHADWKWVGGTAPTLSTTAAAVDRIDYIVAAANKIHAVVSLDVK